MYPVRVFRPGERLKVEKRVCTTNEHMGTQGGKKEKEEVTVISQYPHHVLVENDRGKRFCITNAELYGILVRSGDETLRDAAGKKASV